MPDLWQYQSRLFFIGNGNAGPEQLVPPARRRLGIARLATVGVPQAKSRSKAPVGLPPLVSLNRMAPDGGGKVSTEREQDRMAVESLEPQVMKVVHSRLALFSLPFSSCSDCSKKIEERGRKERASHEATTFMTWLAPGRMAVLSSACRHRLLSCSRFGCGRSGPILVRENVLLSSI